MTDAYVSIQNIVNSWLARRGKTIHSAWQGYLLASEAIRELQLTSMPLLHHTLLVRETGKPYFKLPVGFTDYVRVGARFGDVWRPIGVSKQLMPFPNTEGRGELDSVEFGDDVDSQGDNQSWYSAKTATPASFNPAQFGTGFNTTGTTPASANNPIIGNYPLSLSDIAPNGNIATYWGYDGIRTDAVAFDVAHGLIMCYENYPFPELYLVWTGIGTVDTMTSIPVNAQSTIEAYMDWKYYLNKRGQEGKAREYERLYQDQHRILRARNNNLSTTDIRRIFERSYRGGRNTNLPIGLTRTNTLTNPVPFLQAYFSTQSTSAIPSAGAIVAGTALPYTAGADATVTFANTNPEYLWFAYPVTETLTNYFISTLDNGALGPNGTFAAPVQVGAFYLIISNYPTQTPFAVQFRH